MYPWSPTVDASALLRSEGEGEEQELTGDHLHAVLDHPYLDREQDVRHTTARSATETVEPTETHVKAVCVL